MDAQVERLVTFFVRREECVGLAENSASANPTGSVASGRIQQEGEARRSHCTSFSSGRAPLYLRLVGGLLSLPLAPLDQRGQYPP